MTLTLFSRSQEVKSVENALYALYLLKVSIDFYQTCTDISLGDEIELVIFWWHCLYFQGHRRSKIVERCIVGFRGDPIGSAALFWYAGYLLSQSVEFHQTCMETSLRADKILVTLISLVKDTGSKSAENVL